MVLQLASWGSDALRSGPAYNAVWLPAFNKLKVPTIAARREAVAELAALRDAVSAHVDADGREILCCCLLPVFVLCQWFRQPHTSGRAARHYEHAAQLLVSHCVLTAPVAAPSKTDLLPYNIWAVASGNP